MLGFSTSQFGRVEELGSYLNIQHSSDIFWLKDARLEDRANLSHSDIIVAEIIEDLQAALAQFAEIAGDEAIGF